MTTAGLNLGFADTDDLKVVAAVMQDAVVKTADLVYLGRAKRFALVANRYCWESEGKAMRRRCGLHFDQVRSVRVKGIDRQAVAQVLDLLTVAVEEQENGVTIDLVFAGGAQIRLDAEVVEGGLKDLTEPWSTKHAPKHESDENP